MATADTLDGLSSDVSAALAEGAVAAPDNLDGNLVGVEMDTLQSYVSPYKYLVIGTGGVNAPEKVHIALANHVAQGRPVAVTPVTVQHAKASVERLRHLIVIYNVHRVMSAAHRHPVIRVADTMSITAFDEQTGLTGLRNATSRVYGHLVSSQSRLTRFAKDADLAMLALFANATHRIAQLVTTGSSALPMTGTAQHTLPSGWSMQRDHSSPHSWPGTVTTCGTT